MEPEHDVEGAGIVVPRPQAGRSPARDVATMIPSFLRRPWARRRTEAPAAAVPPGTRVYAIGDVHGELGALTRLLGKIREDAERPAAERRVLIFLGDYVDRGLQSRQVIDLLLGLPPPGFEGVFLKGNHDALLLAFLDGAGGAPEWLGVGGQATLLSYGVALPPGPRDTALFATVHEAFARVFPPAHRAFLEGLALAHVEGDYAFVHAGIRPGIPLRSQQEDDLLWIRDEFIHDRSDHGKIVVHGHSVTGRPELRRNRIGIDTGAYATGRLTCLVLEGASRRFLTSA